MTAEQAGRLAAIRSRQIEGAEAAHRAQANARGAALRAVVAMVEATPSPTRPSRSSAELSSTPNRDLAQLVQR